VVFDGRPGGAIEGQAECRQPLVEPRSAGIGEGRQAPDMRRERFAIAGQVPLLGSTRLALAPLPASSCAQRWWAAGLATLDRFAAGSPLGPWRATLPVPPRCGCGTLRSCLVGVNVVIHESSGGPTGRG
jgi:hypothetical protein